MFIDYSVYKILECLNNWNYFETCDFCRLETLYSRSDDTVTFKLYIGLDTTSLSLYTNRTLWFLLGFKSNNYVTIKIVLLIFN